MLFSIVISIVILQRLIELFVARRNEKWMLDQGAFEAGAAHYPIMVAMHVTFFVSMLLEVMVLGRTLSPIWMVLLGIFLLTQAARVWCLASLGKFWNTKIIILPGADVVRRGPYRWIRHPNYLIVSIELLVLPLLFGAYLTAVLYSLLNVWMLTVRIPAEEKALKDATNYRETFSLE
ncbi:isoprenylcysteine carboxyl methyltransferase family protein [Sporosarcina sp. YIM B06819]|uniref:isoprenylcysteine carboxyl methyltransferase family protein n=1 Tax=Sporosarcina sp. YIM B06819 TaxID=3081769 RepID=UPI00298C12D5|nr:isoprenylcysteine carboxylmethyltransferase family protein [Sporosarcina sp. YIM B06819]